MKTVDIDSKIEKNLVFYDVLDEPFSLHGVTYENGKYRRMPESVARKVSNDVYFLHTNTAGGRIRFKTDSRIVAVNTTLENVGRMYHFALTGSAGFDIYSDNVYAGTFFFPFDFNDSYEAFIEFPDNSEKEITINMPLYSNVLSVYIGLEKRSSLKKSSDYINNNPVIYYGSSITQGGCASRPGNTYQAILSRKYNLDYINLGFSGSAKAEDSIIEYVSSLKSDMFVLDYDHNAPTAEHLKNTHYKFYSEFRSKNPEIPVLLLTRPKYHLDNDEINRLNIVKETYDTALKNGDNNIYFIAGNELIRGEFIETATVDNCHPNDTGFLSMALSIEPVIKRIFNI